MLSSQPAEIVLPKCKEECLLIHHRPRTYLAPGKGGAGISSFLLNKNNCTGRKTLLLLQSKYGTGKVFGLSSTGRTVPRELCSRGFSKPVIARNQRGTDWPGF